MRTAQEQQLVNKIAHDIYDLTLQEIQAITPEILNSKINDGSDKSECSVAFALAFTSVGQEILAANSNALALQISAETLNTLLEWPCAGISVAFVLAECPAGVVLLAANNNMLGHMINAGTLNTVIQQEPSYAGRSVAYALSESAVGRAILAANNNTLGLQINAEALNAIVQQGYYAGHSVAYELADSTEGLAILAANNNALGLQINAEALNAIVQQGYDAGQSLTLALAESVVGRAILAANNYALALQISEKTLYAIIGDSWMSVVGALEQTPEGRTISAVIRERHKNNNVMLALYSSKVQRLGKNSPIKALNRELLDGVLTMLDGRTPQKLTLK